MSIQLRETGWQRFLDRLKELWGKSGHPELSAAAASATDVHGAGASAPVHRAHPGSSAER